MEECWGKRKRLVKREGERPNRRRETVRGMETRASSWSARRERGAGGERHRRKRQVEVGWREVGKGVAPAMMGALEREASAGIERAEWKVAARALAGGGRRGRNAPAPTWQLWRRKTGGSRRLRIGTGGWDANLGRGWARPSDCRSVKRGRGGHRGGGLGRS